VRGWTRSQRDGAWVVSRYSLAPVGGREQVKGVAGHFAALKHSRHVLRVVSGELAVVAVVAVWYWGPRPKWNTPRQ
jgi:hypothetical protein